MLTLHYPFKLKSKKVKLINHIFRCDCYPIRPLWRHMFQIHLSIDELVLQYSSYNIYCRTCQSVLQFKTCFSHHNQIKIKYSNNLQPFNK